MGTENQTGSSRRIASALTAERPLRPHTLYFSNIHLNLSLTSSPIIAKALQGKSPGQHCCPDLLAHSFNPSSPLRSIPPQASRESGELPVCPGRPEIQSCSPASVSPRVGSPHTTLPWLGPVSACTWISGVLVDAWAAQPRAPGDIQGRGRRSAPGRARSIGEQAGPVAQRTAPPSLKIEVPGRARPLQRAPPTGGEKGAAFCDPADPEVTGLSSSVRSRQISSESAARKVVSKTGCVVCTFFTCTFSSCHLVSYWAVVCIMSQSL